MVRTASIVLPLLAALPISSAQDVAITREGKGVEPPVARESRASPDWTYRPNYDYLCQNVGCCGAVNASIPQTANRKPCGPELWKFISNTTLKRCVSDGKSNQQSPIQFITEGPNKMTFSDMSEILTDLAQAEPAFSKTLCAGAIDFKENTWEIDFDKSCKLTVDLLGKSWKLQQFHFHNAEHSINGAYMPLEVHMVHQAADGALLVLGVFLTPGDENTFFKKLESTNGDSGNATTMVDPYTVVPEDRRYWHYKGSLTTPPCQASDNSSVEWFVFRDPVEISINQLGFFGSYFTHLPKAYNGQVNRPLQALASNTKVYAYPPKGIEDSSDAGTAPTAPAGKGSRRFRA